MSADDFKSQFGYTIDRTWYPRVTKILDVRAKPQLMQFYADVGFEKGKEIGRKSAQEGTKVHELVEAMLLHKRVAPPSELAPAISAVKYFLEQNEITTQKDFIERRILHKKHRYAGTLDAIVTIKGKTGVMDIKTSEAIYRDHDIQTAAYFEALREEGVPVSTRWILRIDQFQTCKHCGSTKRTKGGYQKIKLAAAGKTNSLFGNGFSQHYEISKTCTPERHGWLDPRGIIELKEIPYSADDFEAFLGAKKIFEWEHRDLLKKIGY